MRGLSLKASLIGLLAAASAYDETQWDRVARLHGSETVAATVAFHQPRLDEAIDLLNDISNPKSKRFGQYLLDSEVDRMFAPPRESLEAALTWLEDAGIPRIATKLRLGSGLLQFTATVSQMEKLLDADVHTLRHRETGEHRLQESGYSIPKQLEDHIEFINIRSTIPNSIESRNGPRLDSSRPPYLLPARPNLTNCSLSWTPACIRELYSIPLGTKAAPNNALGIFGYGDWYNQTDLNLFFKQYAQCIPNGTTPNVHFINGAQTYLEYIDGEESLDIQMAWPIAYPQKVQIFQMPYSDLAGIANDFLDAVDASYCKYDGGDDPDYDPTYPAFEGFQGPAMCGTYKTTNVISISFAKDESGLSEHYVHRQCHEWMKMALQGVTVLVAAGDRGVSGNFGCSLNPRNSSLSAFNPLFPSTCPYVTTVGATQVNFTKSGYQEVAVYDKKHNYWSGGGFSNFNARPAYQDAAVKQYLATHNPHYPAGTFNASGRAFPDVALLGANVTIVDHGEVVVSGGTSAATPMFAGMISRINDERLLAGKKPIGFLNQILYQHPEVMNDIVQGSNPGCDTGGFQAAKGWDPVSGLGSPSFPKLRALLVSLP